jgi:serine/threonine-protein kinase
MSPVEPLLWERWDEVDVLLAEALDRPAEDRTEFVRQSAAEDDALRDLVLRLLQRIITSEGKSASPPPRMVRAAFAAGAGDRTIEDLQIGDEVGNYRVTGCVGRGGMATVYAAERSDGTYEQRVALKVLRRGLDTGDLVRRFFMERQILSSLSHPHIARLLDGGSTDDGRPYIVMELVDGQPITEWADDRRLDIPQRLRLFLDVVDAVHDAHRQLVVHRDIKPSNVLVDVDGHVKLLDFGIAKLLDGDSAQTEAGVRPLTRDYASPEQLTGGHITTATDVYQLGLLLRELLTGVRPVPGETDPGEPPLRPSRAARVLIRGMAPPHERAQLRSATPERLARQLGGDLDVIGGKALRPDPKERYGTAAELGADVRRHLRGLPIAAHPESSAYRARKFIGRHPMFLPGLAAVLCAIVVFATLIARHSQRLAQERDVAAAASQLAEATQSFFIDLFDSADPYAPADPERGRNITVVEALRIGADRVDEELGDQPVLRAALLSSIAATFSRLDQAEEARAVIQRAVALRIALGDTLSSEFSDDLAVLGDLLNGQDEIDSARAVLARRVRLERARTPAVPERVSNALLGLALASSGVDPLEGARLTEEAVTVLRAAASENVGSALRQLADAYRAIGRWEESESAAREALAVLEREKGPRNASTAMAAHTLGQTLADRGRGEEATVLLRRSLGVFDEQLGPEHTYTMSMRNNLALMLIAREAYVEAESTYRDLLETRSRRFGPVHSYVADTYQNLAVAVAGQERYGDAERLARQAEGIYRQVLPPGSYIIAYPMLTRAEILLADGRAREASGAARGAADLLRSKVPTTHPAAIMADCRLGRARAQLGDVRSGRTLLDSAVRRMESAEGIRAAHLAECRDALAALDATDVPGR